MRWCMCLKLRAAFGHVRRWYEGEVVVHTNPPDAEVLAIGVGCKRHWTASFIRGIVQFHRREWKWTIAIYVAVLGLLVTLFR